MTEKSEKTLIISRNQLTLKTFFLVGGSIIKEVLNKIIHLIFKDNNVRDIENAMKIIKTMHMAFHLTLRLLCNKVDKKHLHLHIILFSNKSTS